MDSRRTMSEIEAKHNDDKLQRPVQHANTNEEDERDTDTFEDATDTTTAVHTEPQDTTRQSISILNPGNDTHHEAHVATDSLESDKTVPEVPTPLAPGAFDADDTEHTTDPADVKKEIEHEIQPTGDSVNEESRPSTAKSVAEDNHPVTADSVPTDSRPSTARSVNAEVATAAGAEDKRSSIDIINQGAPSAEEDDMPRAAKSRQNTLESVPELPPAVPEKETDNEPVKGLSGDLPTLNYPPPPPPPQKSQTFMVSPTIEKPPTTRKVSSPFAWFSRARKATSPSRPTSPRRNTASSLQSLTTNPDSNDDASHPPTLKDRFHLLRLQGESAISTDDSLALPQGRHGRAGSLQSPTKEESGQLSPPFTPRANSFSAISSPTTKLPPGTVSGDAAGPSEQQGDVNWDLWQSVVYEGPSAVARTSGDELNRAIANGIPQPIRGVVWQVMAESKNDELEQVYKELVARGTDKEISQPPAVRRISGTGEKESVTSSASSIHSDVSASVSPQMNGAETFTPAEKKRRSKDETAALQKLEKTIRRDLGARTAYSKYIASAGLQDGLYGICKAYALYDEPVGYAQGMNFIAMPLLFNMPEEEAFTLFVRLMSKYNLRSLFTAEMTGLHLHLYLFERLLEDYEPALYCHLHRRGVPPNLYATQWFLTLFAYRFPLQLVLRVYDLVLSEGLGAILKFGIALMQRNAQTLLEMKDMVQLSTHLKERLFDVYIDKSPSATSILESGFFGSTSSGTDKEVYRADELVRDACAVTISPETLAAYTSEFEEQARLEKDREIELESLRNENTNLSTRVRKLELRTQESDAEHVDLASNLVRTKVENDSLLDENESLKMQVEELRKMVDKQPAEVEDRLKGEMDRIMARNIEVQNSNRALEEQVQETEQELVGTKMMFAQLNAEHDALKQKLRDIQNMLASTDEK
ncbi:RabGAP/TBC [Aureobasidium pullulans]|uniref:GTPase-activating protein GYP5 n=1 Tax=Aureobasidium pullulans TaxID=5580 RepID=A0A4S9K5F6_AURPU|nr:RabGAP/TBC [Aureobasidium pullulans]